MEVDLVKVAIFEALAHGMDLTPQQKGEMNISKAFAECLSKLLGSEGSNLATPWVCVNKETGEVGRYFTDGNKGKIVVKND